jgi:hypothetical protein
MFLALFLAARPLSAQDAAGILPIAEVVEAFKREIRSVQAESDAQCSFSIGRVEFTFLAETHLQTGAGIDGQVEVFGIRLGGGAATTDRNTRISRIRLTLVPRSQGGLEEVTGSAQALQGFGDLIRQTREQIEATAAVDDALRVQEIVIHTGFRIDRSRSGDLNVVVTGESAAGSQDNHEVVLTLGPATEGGC